MKAVETAKARALRELRELREVITHSPAYQDGLALWWDALAPDERRLVLAFAGKDDSEKSAKRKWQQFLIADREEIIAECKALYRICAALRFA